MNESPPPSKPPQRKKARGPQSYIPEDGRATLLYLALAEYNVSSNAGRYGMPFVPGDRDGLMNLQAEIGRALNHVRKIEEKQIGKAVRVSRIERRWRAYMLMSEARALLPNAEWKAKLALWNLERGEGTIEELQDAEEELLQLNAVYYKNKKVNNKLRMGKLYLDLAGEYVKELKRRDIKI